MSKSKTKFSVSINGGPEQTIKVRTGIYDSAAAAVPALLGIVDFPVFVTIWSPKLLPDYGPYKYRIDNFGGAAQQYIDFPA